ncbi:MAG: UbiD family decarboxylase [archaeon]|nr:UbiD family decarboxylase [archaeon]
MTIDLSDVKIIEENIDPDKYGATKYMQDDQNTTFLFKDLNGGKAAGNVYSTREKIGKAMGISKNDIVKHVMDAMASPMPTEIVDSPAFRFSELPLDLTRLPIIKYFPKDAGRYISAGIVVSEYNGKRNVSFHRMLIKDKDTIVIRLVPRHTFTLFNEAKKNGEELKVSICIGAPVEAMVSAALSVDFGTDELTIASSMYNKGHGTPLKAGKCDNGLTVPADCEYVLEGRITFDTEKEGPFVDIAGTYDEIRDQPVIKIDKIWAKKDPVFQLLLPGGWEHFLLMGVPREPVIFKTVRQAVPKVKNVRLTEGGCCWLNGVVSISKNKEGDGVNAIMAAFTGHPSMKNVIIVDDDIDIFDDREVEWAVATRMQADRIIRIPGAAGSSLDPSANGTTWKVGYDATIPVGVDRAPYIKASLQDEE